MNTLPPWRRKLGLGLLGLGLVTPVLGLAVPLLGLPPAAATALTGALVVGGPEVLMVLSAMAMGKEGMKEALGRVVSGLKAPAGPFRYYVSLVAMGVSSIVPWALYGYLPHRMPDDPGAQTLVFAVSDGIFVAAFLAAGPGFWSKLSQLLTWTEPETG